MIMIQLNKKCRLHDTVSILSPSVREFKMIILTAKEFVAYFSAFSKEVFWVQTFKERKFQLSRINKPKNNE